MSKQWAKQRDPLLDCQGGHLQEVTKRGRIWRNSLSILVHAGFSQLSKAHSWFNFHVVPSAFHCLQPGPRVCCGISGFPGSRSRELWVLGLSHLSIWSPRWLLLWFCQNLCSAYFLKNIISRDMFSFFPIRFVHFIIHSSSHSFVHLLNILFG